MRQFGELLVPKQYRKLIRNSDGTLKEVFFTVSGRKIPLAEIRKRELERCEQLGIVTGHTNQEYEQMSDEQVRERLKVLGDDGNHLGDTPEQRKEWLMGFEKTRHLMVSGDGSILNHGHLLYLIQCVYDPAFFLHSCRNERQGIWCH